MVKAMAMATSEGRWEKGRWYMIVIPSEKVRSIEADLYSLLHLKYTCTHKIYIQT